MRKVQDHWDSVRIEIGPVLNANLEILPPDQTSKAVLLQIKESGRALDVGKGSGILFLKELKPLSACRTELQVSYEFLMMQLADPKEIKYLFIQVIQDLDSGRLLVEKDLGPAAERFDVSGMFGDQRDDLAGNTVLAA